MGKREVFERKQEAVVVVVALAKTLAAAMAEKERKMCKNGTVWTSVDCGEGERVKPHNKMDWIGCRRGREEEKNRVFVAV